MTMNKLQEKLSQASNKAKLLVPMTLIALIGVFNSWCGKTPTFSKEQVNKYEKMDLNKNIINVGEWVYLYPLYGNNVLKEEEIWLVVSQFLSNNPDKKIVAIARGGFRSNWWLIIITEPKIPCPCEKIEN